jgi:hypothetical protein
VRARPRACPNELCPHAPDPHTALCRPSARAWPPWGALLSSARPLEERRTLGVRPGRSLDPSLELWRNAGGTPILLATTGGAREIGIRKAIDANGRTILTQFLLAVILCNIGRGDRVLFCSAVGIASGLLPAIRASRLHPIDALRYEWQSSNFIYSCLLRRQLILLLACKELVTERRGGYDPIPTHK